MIHKIDIKNCHTDEAIPAFFPKTGDDKEAEVTNHTFQSIDHHTTD